MKELFPKDKKKAFDHVEGTGGAPMERYKLKGESLDGLELEPTEPADPNESPESAELKATNKILKEKRALLNTRQEALAKLNGQSPNLEALIKALVQEIDALDFKVTSLTSVVKMANDRRMLELGNKFDIKKKPDGVLDPTQWSEGTVNNRGNQAPPETQIGSGQPYR